MSRIKSKQQLIDEVLKEKENLTQIVNLVPKNMHEKHGVSDKWSVKDIFAHMHEWHNMILHWYKQGKENRVPELPAPGYNWRQTPELNDQIYEKYKNHSYKEILHNFERTHMELLGLINDLSEKEILEPGVFEWTGKLGLASYLAPSTCNHYRWAMREIKKWLKSQNF